MKTIAIANHKGGVGKTATTHALGAGLAGLGQRVLLVDIDPQSSLTAACGVEASGESLAEVFGGAAPGTLSITDIVLDVGNGDHLHLAPADIALSTNEPGLIQRYGRENLLKREMAKVSRAYDIALIDCPPSLGILTINALNAADAVLIPTQPQISDLRGLRLFLDTLRRLRGELNPDLVVMGILPTFVDSRLLHHQDALQVMQENGLPLFAVQIGRSVKVAEAAASGESVITYDPTNKQAENYQQLAKVVVEWLRNAQK